MFLWIRNSWITYFKEGKTTKSVVENLSNSFSYFIAEQEKAGAKDKYIKVYVKKTNQAYLGFTCNKNTGNAENPNY
jgi:hypothetical protein